MHTSSKHAPHTAGAMRGGGAQVGSMPRKILFYIYSLNFFPQETQLSKGAFRIPEKILHETDYLFALSYFF